MSSDIGFKAMNAIHRILLKVSGGRAGWTAMGMPVLELTTTGRKSGQPRQVMLTSPWQEGSVLVVVASRGGDDNAPAWFLNLQENPDVEVSLQGAGGRGGLLCRGSTLQVHHRRLLLSLTQVLLSRMPAAHQRSRPMSAGCSLEMVTNITTRRIGIDTVPVAVLSPTTRT